MLKLISIVALLFSFSTVAQPNHRNDHMRPNPNRRPPARRPILRPPPRDYVQVVGQTTLESYNTWKRVPVLSCSRYGLDGDQLKLQLDNDSRADIDQMDVVFGNGQRQRISIGKREFTTWSRETQWKDLRGHRRTDRCVREVWLYGRSTSWERRARINILMKDEIRR